MKIFFVSFSYYSHLDFSSDSNTATILSEEGKKCPLNGIRKDHPIVPLDEPNLSTLTAVEQSINNSKEIMDKLTAKFGMFQTINNVLNTEYKQVAEQVIRNALCWESMLIKCHFLGPH